MSDDNKIKELSDEHARLVAERQERSRSVPAHSIRPHQLLILEELDERISALEREIEALSGPTGKEGL